VKIEIKKYNDFYVQPKTHHLLFISTELSFQVVLLARIGEKLSGGIKPTWFKNTLYLAPWFQKVAIMSKAVIICK
jgi:hypothetical protein